MQRAGLQGAFEGREVYADEPEMLVIAGGPLEIVEQRPVEIRVNGNTLVEAVGDARQRLVDEGDTARVVAGRDAVLGDVDRLFDRRMRPADRVCKRLRIELIARIPHLRG